MRKTRDAMNDNEFHRNLVKIFKSKKSGRPTKFDKRVSEELQEYLNNLKERILCSDRRKTEQYREVFLQILWRLHSSRQRIIR